MYRGSLGPGMLETTRLNVRGLATMREIAAWTTPGVCSAALSARSAPSGSPSRLRWLMVACTRYRRPSGSGSSHGRSANTNEMWLPSTSAGERTFTGTIALSGVRYSPRRIMRARMAPVTAASMTSLTVVSYVRFTFCRSSSGRWVQARRRSGESAPLIELAVAPQWHGHDFIDEPRQRTFCLEHVAIDGEAVIVDPLGSVQAEGDWRELLAIARGAGEAAPDVITQLLERREAAVSRWREDGNPADVHVRGGRLNRQERRVETRQTRAAHNN